MESMKKRELRAKKITVIGVMLSVVTLLFIIVYFTITAEAQTGIVFGTYDGDIYGSQTGWVQAGDDLYYFHSTNGMAYKKGEACRNDYRWRGRELYYFGPDGKAVKKNTRYLKFHSDHSVMHIYIPGANGERFNADTMHYQRYIDGVWQDVGMETNIPWMCDWQAMIQTGDRCA